MKGPWGKRLPLSGEKRFSAAALLAGHRWGKRWQSSQAKLRCPRACRRQFSPLSPPIFLEVIKRPQRQARRKQGPEMQKTPSSARSLFCQRSVDAWQAPNRKSPAPLCTSWKPMNKATSNFLVTPTTAVDRAGFSGSKQDGGCTLPIFRRPVL